LFKGPLYRHQYLNSFLGYKNLSNLKTTLRMIVQMNLGIDFTFIPSLRREGLSLAPFSPAFVCLLKGSVGQGRGGRKGFSSVPLDPIPPLFGGGWGLDSGFRRNDGEKGLP
jgi:hypothetical protein